MARVRFVVRDLSTYVAPVGGRCPKWGVLDTKLSGPHGRPVYRDTTDTRGEARTRAARRNRDEKSRLAAEAAEAGRDFCCGRGLASKEADFCSAQCLRRAG